MIFKEKPVVRDDFEIWLKSTPKTLRECPLRGDALAHRLATETMSSSLHMFIAICRETGNAKWQLLALQRVVQIAPEVANIVELVNLLLQHKRGALAHAIMGSAISEAIPAAQYHALFARTAAAIGELETALNSLDVLVAQQPDRALQAWSAIANEYVNLGDTPALQRLVEHNAKIFAKNTAKELILAKLAMLEEGPQAALAICRSIEKTPATIAEVERLELNLMFDAGHYLDVIALCKSAIKKSPKDWFWFEVLFMASVQMQRLPRDINVLKTVFKFRALNSSVCTLYAKVKLRLGENDKALAAIQDLEHLNEWAWLQMKLEWATLRATSMEVDQAYLECQRGGNQSGEAEFNYASFRLFFNPSDKNRAKALTALAEIEHGATFERLGKILRQRILIAQGNWQEAEQQFLGMPQGLQKSAQLLPLGAFFAAQNEDIQAAKQIYSVLLRQVNTAEHDAALAYPVQKSLKYKSRKADILVFVTLYNGMEYLPWFLSYYREMGVAHFFITDNGSDDGSFEYLQQQKDVSVFYSDESFGEAGCGTFWANHLMQRFGKGHWCLHLDMDEALVFPGMEDGRSLTDLVNYLDAGGAQSVLGQMIDIYPDNEDTKAYANGFAASRYIDTDYEAFAYDMAPYQFITGGVRSRLTGRSMLMTKAPLLKMTGRESFLTTNHHHTPVQLGDLSVALLHYKFVGEWQSRVDDAIARKEHFDGASFYVDLKRELSKAGGASSLMSEYSVEFLGTEQLIELGLLETSYNWDRFVHKMPRT